MTMEELTIDNAERHAYAVKMGFPDFAPLSQEAMAQDAPKEVVLAELMRLLTTHNQSLETFKNILLHRRELGLDGGHVERNEYIEKWEADMAAIGINDGIDSDDEDGEYEGEGEGEEEVGNGRLEKGNGSKSG